MALLQFRLHGQGAHFLLVACILRPRSRALDLVGNPDALGIFADVVLWERA